MFLQGGLKTFTILLIVLTWCFWS